MFWHDDELANDARQFAIARPVKREGDFTLAGLLGLDDVAIVGPLHRAVLLEHVERKDDVVRRDGIGVMPAGGRTQAKPDE